VPIIEAGEQERAAARCEEGAFAFALRAREGSGDVAEELARCRACAQPIRPRRGNHATSVDWRGTVTAVTYSRSLCSMV
jgi:hypothetical protein